MVDEISEKEKGEISEKEKRIAKTVRDQTNAGSCGKLDCQSVTCGDLGCGGFSTPSVEQA
jgi:hypothetical protein